MDEENKKINIDSFFNRIEEVDQVAGKALKKSNLNASAIQANKTLIDSLSLTIETMKTEIRDIANYIIIERKLEKDAEEDRKLELEDAEQKKSMTDRALALAQPTSEKKSIAPQSGSEGSGGGGGFLSGLLGAIATGGLIALATPLVPVIAPLLLKAMAAGISLIVGGVLLKKFMPAIKKQIKNLSDTFKAGFQKTKEIYKNLEGRVKDSLKKVGDSFKAGFEKTKELYKNLEGKFLKLAGDVGGFLKKKGKQSINLLKRTTGGVADFVTGGVFDFDKKGEGITDNVLIGNKLAAQGLKGVIDNMKDEDESESFSEYRNRTGNIESREGESEELKEEEKKFKVTTGKEEEKKFKVTTGKEDEVNFKNEFKEGSYEFSSSKEGNVTSTSSKFEGTTRFDLETGKAYILGEEVTTEGYNEYVNLPDRERLSKDGMMKIIEKHAVNKVEPFKENKNVNIEVQKKNDLDLSLGQSLEINDKLINAVSYQSEFENKDQNGSVIVQNKPAQVTIASIKRTSSPVAFIKSNKNKFLSINETELPPEVARMLT